MEKRGTAPKMSARISLRARWLLTLYRWVVKPMLPRFVDLAQAKVVMAKLDRWLGGMDRSFSRRPVSANGLPAEWITVKKVRAERVILYLHGGGFMFSTPRLHARLAARLCRVLDAKALMPEYRLAPDNPLPAAHEDCFAAYGWLLAEGHDAKHIVIVGDSAGGLLTLSTLQRIRDAGLPLPSCGVMFSPGTCVDSIRLLDETATRDDPLVGQGILDLLQRTVVAQVAPSDSRISPCAGSLHALPPLLFQAGSTEMLLSHSRKAFELARAGGTQAELQVWPQMPHVWQAVHWLPEARDALKCVAEFVSRHNDAHVRGVRKHSSIFQPSSLKA